MERFWSRRTESTYSTWVPLLLQFWKQHGAALGNEPGLEMDRRELDRYKQMLLAKQDELSVKNANGESLVPAAGGRDGDPTDRATADEEAELQIRFHQTDGPLLRAIEGALDRIRQGTFGVCDACNNPISRARLEAVPWTRHCRDCKEHEQA
jgi:DnaK suppressor protein